MDEKGQALVETAWVVPLLVLFSIVLIQLVIMACTKIRLLQSNARSAQAAALGDGAHGMFAQTEALSGWKPYSGVSTLNTPGRLVVVQHSEPLSYTTLHSRAGFMEEPRIPGEQQ